MPSPTNQGGTMTKRPMTGCTQMTQHRLLQLPRLRGQQGHQLLKVRRPRNEWYHSTFIDHRTMPGLGNQHTQESKIMCR